MVVLGTGGTPLDVGLGGLGGLGTGGPPLAIGRGDMGCLGTRGPPLAIGRGGLGRGGPSLAGGLGALGRGRPPLAGGLGTGAPPLAGLGVGGLAACGWLVGHRRRSPAVPRAGLCLGVTRGQQ